MGGEECEVRADTRRLLRRYRPGAEDNDRRFASEGLNGNAQLFLKADWVHNMPAVHTEAQLAAVEANRCY